jgi:predicted ATPase/class 3 adenylate cyclase
MQETKHSRRLVAIMFTDMVGYSALAQKNEALALELLEEHRRLLRPMFPMYDGKEIETAGDAFFVEFASALEAARCAVAIQTILHERNAGVPAERQILLRIGLHIGDVVYMDDHVHGDGVNIAARLEPCAEAGGICLSEDVARQIQNKLDLPLQRHGRRQLKNIDLPMEIYSIVLPWQDQSAVSMPPLAQRETFSNNLPLQLTSFVGREIEVEQIQNLLMTSSLVTLSGPGGTGKTRLALSVAGNMLNEFEDGVFVVQLAPITDPELMLPTVAQTLGVKEVTGRPAIDSLRNHLRTKHLLLVLDNFEQVISAAPKVAELVSACPNLKVLVTSRFVLRLSGEHEYPVAPLKLPNLGQLPKIEVLLQYAAVELFIQRAQAAKSDFVVTNENAPAVAEICVRLDGLPLAIELAAARIKLLTPHALLARLGTKFELLRSGARDLPARHQTLRQAIAWSYDLLSSEEKALFRRLTVFVGGCTLESAEAVCTVIGDLSLDVLDGMEALVDRSLLRREERGGEPRFLMLETIREYGLECLRASAEEEQVRRVHAEYFISLAERAEPELNGPQQAAWFDRFDAEHDNLRAVFRWAEEHNEIEMALLLFGELQRFWVVRGHMTEWEERVTPILAVDSRPSRARAKALIGVALMAQNHGKYAEARTHLDEALAIWRSLGDKVGIATALDNLGWVSWRFGDFDTMRTLCSESLELHREMRDRVGAAVSLTNLGFGSLLQGDYASSTSQFEEALAIRRELGDQRGTAYVTALLGWVAKNRGRYDDGAKLVQEGLSAFHILGDELLSALAVSLLSSLMCDIGDYVRAKEMSEQSLAIFSKLGNKWGVALCLSYLGNAAFLQDDLVQAETRLVESRRIFSEIESKWGVASALNFLANLSCVQKEYGKAYAFFKEALSLRNIIGDKLGISDCLSDMAVVAIEQRLYERAGNVLGAGEALREKIGGGTPKAARERYERAETEIRSKTGDGALDAGRAMTIEQAVALALS